jgi:hypothetical protein
MLLFLTTLAYSQTNWITLSYPQSDIFGKAVLNIEKGDLNFLPHVPPFKTTKLDESTSSDEVNEYNEKFKSFISKYFSSAKFSVTEVKAKKLVIKSLNIQDVKKLSSGSKYIFSAISADSVEVIVKSKKSKDVDYTKAIKDISSLITGDKAVEVVTKIIPFFDSISTHREDSLSYKMVLANPNVYYKVKLIKYKGITKHDWENRYWKNFTNPNGIIKSNRKDGLQPTFNLIYTPLETQNSTPSIYPEVWGGGDPKHIRFRLCTKKVDGELKLYIQHTGSIDGTWNDYEVKSETVDGKKYWKLDRALIYSFEIGKITKLVYIQVRGEENGKDTIMIKSWGSSMQDKLTFMQYPEVKFEYLKK